MGITIELRRGGPLQAQVDIFDPCVELSGDLLQARMRNIGVEFVSVDMLDEYGGTIETTTYDGGAVALAVRVPKGTRKVRFTGEPERKRDEIPANARPIRREAAPERPQPGHPTRTMQDAINASISGKRTPTRIALSEHDSVVIDQQLIEVTDAEFGAEMRGLAEQRATTASRLISRRRLTAEHDERGHTINTIATGLGRTLDRYEAAVARAADLGRAARAAHQAGETARAQVAEAERLSIEHIEHERQERARADAAEQEAREALATVAEQRAELERLRDRVAELDNQEQRLEAWRERAQNAEERVDRAEAEARSARDLIIATADALTPGRSDKDLVLAAREVREQAGAADAWRERAENAEQQVEELSHRAHLEPPAAQALQRILDDLVSTGYDLSGQTLAAALTHVREAWEAARQQLTAAAEQPLALDDEEFTASETIRADAAEKRAAKVERKLKRERRRRRDATADAARGRARSTFLQERLDEANEDLDDMTKHRDSLNVYLDETIARRDMLEHDLGLAREELDAVRSALAAAERLVQERDAKLAGLERAEKIAKVVDGVRETGRPAAIGGVELWKPAPGKLRLRSARIVGHVTPEQIGANEVLRKLYGDSYVDDVLGTLPARHINAPCAVEPVLVADGDRAEADRLLALVRRVVSTGQARLTHGIMLVPGEQYAHLRDVSDNRPVSLRTHARTVRNLRRARADRRALRAMLASIELIASTSSAK